MGKTESTPVKLFLVGDARIVTPTGVLDPSAELVFSAALYLSLEGREPIARRKLEELLWPEVSSETAAHRLRQTLFKLRRFGFSLQPVGRAQIMVDRGLLSIDFESLRANEQHGPFDADQLCVLPGFSPRFSRPYTRWLEARIESIEAILAREALAQIARLRVSGRWTEVETRARHLLVHAPENEQAALALAEALAMRGEKVEGVRVLEKYLAEMGRAPSDLRIPATIMRRRIAEQIATAGREIPLDTPLVGREQFLTQLTTLLDSSRASGPNIAVILGEPGIGKTRLLNEFLSFARLQGVPSHQVTCRSTDSSRPLAVLLELIPLLRSMRGAIGSSPDTLEFFDTLTTHRPRRTTSTASGRAGDFASAGLDAAMIDIVDAVTEESPLVIAVEDCQWIDSASAVGLARLFERLEHQRLLIVLTSRGPLDPSLGEVRPTPVSIQLLGLDDVSSNALMQSIVRQRDGCLSEDYLAWCANVAEGNPFFLHELASHWLETGEEHVAPPSLTSVLRQRLSRVTRNSLQVLQASAVLENHSTINNLEAVLGYPAHELLHSIHELAGAGMVSIVGKEGTTSHIGSLTSRHDLLSEVALMLLTPPARAYLHRCAARVLEAAIEGNGDASMLWSCAKHWQLAGDTAQALRLATSCANHLLEAGLSNDAADAFMKAETYCVTDVDLLKNLEGQATALYRSSNWRLATSTIRRARALKTRSDSTSNQHDDLELMQLRADWQTMDWNEILGRSIQCLEAANAQARHRMEAGVMALMMLSFRGDIAKATAVFGLIENLCSDEEPNTDVLLQAAMVYHTNWGSFDQAVIAASSLIEQHRKRGDIGTLFRSLCNASVTLRAVGRCDEASSHLREALELADRHALHLSKSRALPMLANMSLEIGRITEARAWLQQLSRCPITKDDKLGQAEVSAISARIALLENRYDEAAVLIRRDLSEMRDDQVAHRRAYATALEVALELALSQRASPESLRDLESAHIESRSNLFQAFATYALYAGLRSVNKRAKASRLLREYIEIYRREPSPPPVHLLDSIMSLAGNRRTQRQPRTN